MPEDNYSEGEEELEDSKLLKKEKEEGETKEEPKRVCGTQARIILSGVAVLALVSVGVIFGASYSSRKDARHKSQLNSQLNDPKACSRSPSERPLKIRLPENVIPQRYRIYIHPNITDMKFGFNGNVKILVEVKSATDEIVLHSQNLKIGSTMVLEAGESHDLDFIDELKKVPLAGKPWHCEPLEQLVIKLGKKLPAGGWYVVHIGFSATLATVLEGFYKSSYTTKAGEKRYLGTTHFEATGARSAFPCFDEPAMKASFTMVIVKEPQHTALSNMPIEKTERRRQDGLDIVYFKESVRMSTYLVAFVICDYDSLKAKTKGGVEIGAYAPPESINQTQFALESAVKILDYYDTFFKTKFPLPKLDIIAIPDFGAGAMENWGLVTYRLTSILYDPNESSSASKQWVATVVAHEFAHQWFGDLVTMKWWNDLWLNEGFAAFVEYIGADVVQPNWQMKDQFILDNVQRSMVLDSHRNSHPIQAPVKDPAQIAEIFDAISYDKGSSIIRMMQDFIGVDVFQKGLANYLNKYKYGNAISDDLWAEMTKALKKSSPGSTLNVKKIMDTWTLQMGYPVVTVHRKPGDKTVTLTQKHFITDVASEGEKKSVVPKSVFGYKWDIPLTYHFDTKKPADETKRQWFYHTQANTSIPWDSEATWLKVNCDQIGFYRVNYDNDNWRALQNQLLQDHTKLSDADRAHLLDDVFELARAELVPTVQALDMTRYMPNEVKYIPFVSGIGSIGYIGGMLLERPGYKLYERYIMTIILPRVAQVGWKDEGSHLDKYLRGVVLRSAVYHNNTQAVEEALRIFDDWMVKGTRIPANLRSIMYLAGIKFGGRKQWDFMFNAYMKSQFASEKKKLMVSLTSSSDPNILQHYLDLSINNDVIKSQDSCSVIESIAGNRKGRKLAIKFVKKHWDLLFERYGHTSFDMSRLIKAVFGGARTVEEYEDAKDFLTNRDLGSGRLAGKQTLAAILNHINWLKKNEKDVTEWFRNALNTE